MRTSIIWCATVFHVTWAVLLLFSMAPVQVTGIALPYRIFPNRFLLAGILLLSSALAWLAINRYRSIKSILLLLPQQFILVLSAINVLTVIYNGRFSNGAMYSRSFLTADKISIIIFATFHTLALLQFHKTNQDL